MRSLERPPPIDGQPFAEYSMRWNTVKVQSRDTCSAQPRVPDRCWSFSVGPCTDTRTSCIYPKSVLRISFRVLGVNFAATKSRPLMLVDPSVTLSSPAVKWCPPTEKVLKERHEL